MNDTLNELKNKICRHNLGDKEEAFKLYEQLCSILKKKYGLVDRNYDEKPTTRGKEWIDIHHILEYELDDIARRTNFAKDVQRKQYNHKDNEFVLIFENIENIEKEVKNTIKENKSIIDSHTSIMLYLYLKNNINKIECYLLLILVSK